MQLTRYNASYRNFDNLSIFTIQSLPMFQDFLVKIMFETLSMLWTRRPTLPSPSLQRTTHLEMSIKFKLQLYKSLKLNLWKGQLKPAEPRIGEGTSWALTDEVFHWEAFLPSSSDMSDHIRVLATWRLKGTTQRLPLMIKLTFQWQQVVAQTSQSTWSADLILVDAVFSFIFGRRWFSFYISLLLKSKWLLWRWTPLLPATEDRRWGRASSGHLCTID